jgi:hypothetical protein
MTKHFFKALIFFILIIIIGMFGIIVLNNVDKNGTQNTDNGVQVAK